MKKLITLFITIILCACLFVGCEIAEVQNEATNKDKSMFILVEQANDWKVLYHQETKVMYVVSDGSYNHGTFVVLVNADGTPMIWEGN